MKKIFLFIIIVLIVGGFLIKSSLDTDFGESDDRKSFVKEFAKWVFQVGKSTKNTVGFAVQQEWVPVVNESNMTEIVVD